MLSEFYQPRTKRQFIEWLSSWDKVMEQNIADNDLEALWAHLVEARNLLRED